MKNLQQRQQLYHIKVATNYLPDWWTAGMHTVCTTDQLVFVRIPKLHSSTNSCAPFSTFQTLLCALFHLKLQK